MKKYTEMVFILDRSGSMGGLETDTIGGFNSMLAKQKELGDDAIVSTVLFDHEIQVITDRKPINKVKALTDKEYYARGCTALLDAMGGAVEHIESCHKRLPKEERPEKTVFVITTDGLENSSKKYSQLEVRLLVERAQDKFGWEFIFLGANMDAITEGAKLGVRADRSVNFVCDSEGTELNYKTISNAVGCIRKAMPLEAGWAGDIEKDYKKRSRKSRKS